MNATGQPTPYGHFTVSSGALCYGALHNIWHGASVPVQGFPSARPDCSGTVMVHHLEYNTAALNGRWNAFQLIEQRSDGVVGWFLAHVDTNPRTELARILRVSGSPYEEESGSSSNDDSTEAEGILVINRYDWGYYDTRATGVTDGGIEPDPDMSNEAAGFFIAIGLVDYAAARPLVRRWKEQHTSEREWRDGAWLYNPGEYMFGRFGFTADKTAACSFLCFSTHTNFAHTQLADSTHTLLKPETAEERFKRRLREGYDFSGLKELHRRDQPPDDLRGPYPATEYILTEADIAAVHSFPSVARLPRKAQELGYRFERFLPFADELAAPTSNLINEMFLSWLDRCILGKQPEVSAEAHFPHHRETRHVDREAHRCFAKVEQEPIPQLDGAGVRSRIAAFLHSRSWSVPDEFIASLFRVVEYLLLELIELADNWTSLYAPLKKITPQEIRLAVLDDDQLSEILGHSAFYWTGSKSIPH